MIFEMPSCTGCKTCEMACSLKLLGAFSTSHAAISILNRPDKPGYLISLAEKTGKDGKCCIGCQECVRICPVGEDLSKIVLLYQSEKKRGY